MTTMIIALIIALSIWTFFGGVLHHIAWAWGHYQTLMYANFLECVLSKCVCIFCPACVFWSDSVFLYSRCFFCLCVWARFLSGCVCVLPVGVCVCVFAYVCVPVRICFCMCVCFGVYVLVCGCVCVCGWCWFPFQLPRLPWINKAALQVWRLLPVKECRGGTAAHHGGISILGVCSRPRSCLLSAGRGHFYYVSIR